MLQLLFLPVRSGVSAANFLDKASTFKLGSSFKGLRCTLKMDALSFIPGRPADKRKKEHVRLLISRHIKAGYKK